MTVGDTLRQARQMYEYSRNMPKTEIRKLLMERFGKAVADETMHQAHIYDSTKNMPDNLRKSVEKTMMSFGPGATLNVDELGLISIRANGSVVTISSD